MKNETQIRNKAEKEIISFSNFPMENPNPCLCVNKDRVLIDANEPALHLLEKWNCKLFNLIPGPFKSSIDQAFSGHANGEVEINIENRIFIFDIVSVPAKEYINLYGRDITDLKKAGSLVVHQNRILEMIATGKDLTDILDAITSMTEKHLEGVLCAILILDQETSRMYYASAPNIPKDYVKDLDGFIIGPKVGSCGTAAFHNKTVIAENIATEPLWADYKHIALESGIKACWSSPIRDSHGKVLGTFALFPDQARKPDAKELEFLKSIAPLAGITIEQKQAENRINVERQNMFDMLEQLPVAFHLQAPDHSVPFANRMFRERYGKPEKKPCYEVMHKRSKPCETCIPFSIFETGKTESSVWTDLNGITYLTVMTPFRDIDGGPLVMEMAIDISEQKKAEEDLILTKNKAEKASQAKSEFLSRMSHELRTPMNAILGFGQLLDYDTKDPLTDSQKEKIQEILKAGEHLLELINEVLDLSLVESGQLSLSVEDFSLVNVIDDALALIRPLAVERNIKITNHLSNHPDLFIQVDPIRFKQALLNLLSNAIKYNPEGGSIILDFQKNDEGRIRIDVTDTGEGISKENQDLIFQPFNRLDAKNSAVEGTGIGLSITKRLIELMNGVITVHSAPGEGSRFSIEIPEGKQLTPTKENREVFQKLKAPENSGQQKWTLLYVEDNASNLMLVELIIKTRPDIKFLSAPQAQTGIDLAREHMPDLILMDINMPELDGLTAMKNLQKFEETRHIPIIAVSANAMESEIKNGLEAGFKGYITKPFNIPKLFMEIDRFLKPEN
jgi:signal transduction histidine kinase/ActR/RegA family two-component response regulator